jgi:hypothetical protein
MLCAEVQFVAESGAASFHQAFEGRCFFALHCPRTCRDDAYSIEELKEYAALAVAAAAALRGRFETRCQPCNSSSGAFASFQIERVKALSEPAVPRSK